MFEIRVFSERMKTARVEKRLSQAELAKAVGVSAATISSYETTNDPKMPSLDKAAAIAEALGVSLDWLCGKENAGKVQITDFDVETYLRSLVVTITEMSTTFARNVNGEGELTFSKDIISDFVGRCLDVLKVYRNGTLTQELYEMCIDKIISSYSNNLFEYDNFLTKEESEKVHENLCYYDANGGIGQGVFNLALSYSTVEGSDFFMSEKGLENFYKGVSENGSNNPPKE